VKGPGGGYGVEARRGAELCMEDPAGLRGLRLEPVFREESVGADPAAAVADLADHEGVLAIIGPLRSESAERVLPAAARRALPVISPTAGAAGLGEASPVFFRTCLTMDAFAAALADALARRLGRPAVAIVAPAERYGRTFAAAVRKAVEERAGTVALVREYQPGLRDLAPWADALARQLHPPGPAGWSVGAIVLAGSAEEAGMILPRLAYAGADPRSVTVIGGSALNTPGFPRLAGGYAEGALIADGFFAGSAQPAARAFVRRYRERYGADPGAAAAQACAAVEALAEALAGGADTPRRTLDALGAGEEIATVLGRIRLLPGGRVERRAFFLRVKAGALADEPEP
jgi:branched-chain amino acid transport system substrate-binding protein